MRNMAFSMTTPQFKARTKTVTRRWGWKFLKPGDVVMGIVKGQGLKKGEKVEKLHPIKIVSVNREPLYEITKSDCIKEGFPDFGPMDFICMMGMGNRNKEITRIEFEHIIDW